MGNTRFPDKIDKLGPGFDLSLKPVGGNRYLQNARVAELADASDLGSDVYGRGGSSPLSRTIYSAGLVAAVSGNASQHRELTEAIAGGPTRVSW